MTEQHVELNGEIIEVAKGGFKILVEGTEGSIIYARLSGKMRTNKIRVLLGDYVTVKVSVYDMTNGFIVSRN